MRSLQRASKMKILGGRIIIFVALVISSCLFGESSAMNAALNAAAASMRQQLSGLIGRRADDPNFRHVGRLRGNARPRRYSLRERITEEMFRMLCAYVFAVLFTRTQMHCQIYCSFWIYDDWLSSLLVIVRFYGWAIATLLNGAGGGRNDGGRGYFRNTRLTGALGAPFTNNLLEEVALKSLAVFLNCRMRDLPPGLRQVPHSDDLYSLAFIALVDYMPLLEIVVCCHNRCKSACRRRDLSPRQTDGICKAYIYASDSVSSNLLLDGVRRRECRRREGRSRRRRDVQDRRSSQVASHGLRYLLFGAGSRACSRTRVRRLPAQVPSGQGFLLPRLPTGARVWCECFRPAATHTQAAHL